MKNKTIKKLNEIKGYNNYINAYADMVNAAIDYDNEMQDDVYLNDAIGEFGFTDNEFVVYYIKNIVEDYDLDRLRWFIGDAVGDEIYIIDGYGILDNVTMDDIIMCIDVLLEKLEDH